MLRSNLQSEECSPNKHKIPNSLWFYSYLPWMQEKKKTHCGHILTLVLKICQCCTYLKVADCHPPSFQSGEKRVSLKQVPQTDPSQTLGATTLSVITAALTLMTNCGEILKNFFPFFNVIKQPGWEWIWRRHSETTSTIYTVALSKKGFVSKTEIRDHTCWSRSQLNLNTEQCMNIYGHEISAPCAAAVGSASPLEAIVLEIIHKVLPPHPCTTIYKAHL